MTGSYSAPADGRGRYRRMGGPTVIQIASVLARVAVVALMCLGSVSLWVFNPLLWLWLTSYLESGSLNPSMGPYGLLLVGIILTSVGLARGLVKLNELYGRLTGTTPTMQLIMPWRRSLRGGRSRKRETDGRLPVSVLDVVMVISVVAAIVAFGVWYVTTNPTAPNVGGPGPAKH